MMIELTDGSFVNSDHVWRIEEVELSAPGKAQSLLHIEGGPDRYGVAIPSVLAAAINGTVIPAAPGYAVLMACEGKWRIDVIRQIIIAWRVGYLGIPEPVTVEGTASGSILQPDGKVCVQGLCTFDNEEQWVVEIQEDFRLNGGKAA